MIFAGPLGCGDTFTEDSGIITSPNYPRNYEHNTNCVMTIVVTGNKVITLYFTDMDIEGTYGAHCSYDYIEVWYSLNIRVNHVKYD